MNEQEFDAAAEAMLARIEAALEGCAADLDFDRMASGVLEIEIAGQGGGQGADGVKIVINRHDAAREIWIAAPAGGYHFRREGDVWRDTRDGAELLEKLAQLLSAYCGAALVLE